MCEVSSDRRAVGACLPSLLPGVFLTKRRQTKRRTVSAARYDVGGRSAAADSFPKEMLSLVTFAISFHGVRLPPAMERRRALAPVLCDAAQKLSEYQRLQEELADAVEAEDYALAATLRDKLSSSVMDDQMAILACNAEFYAAFSAADYDRMDGVWADDNVACIHPGLAPIYGQADVMASWKAILSNNDGARVVADGVRCMLMGTSAVVTCVERVDGSLPLAATNVFSKTERGNWRMVLHQAGGVSRGLDE